MIQSYAALGAAFLMLLALGLQFLGIDHGWQTLLTRMILLVGIPFAVYASVKFGNESSDDIVGMQAVVTTASPLQVEARGSVWQAKVAGSAVVQAGARVRVVGRSGLTLVVEPIA